LGKAPEPSHRVHHHDHDEHVQTLSFDGPAPSSAAPDAIEGAPKEDSEKTGSREPRTALEHYEKAVERETLGSLGDSLSLYRKAFRMDHRVDQEYKKKHFPVPASSSAKQAAKAPASTPAAAANAPPPAPEKLTTTQLIHSFASLTIEPAPPPVEGDPPPLSPLATLPHEI
ncbi:hypothetical protein DH86_00002632, partial [Scytalidium sp. 3C]